MIDIVITCKDRLPHLRKSYVTLLKAIGQRKNIRVIIVAYGDILAYRWAKNNAIGIMVEAKGFNLSAARNIGAAQCKSDWILFADADTIFESNFFDELNLEAGCYYTGEPHCSGNCIVKREDFIGYDENFIGYGGEDVDLYIGLTRKKLIKKQLFNFSYIMHNDFERLRNYKGEKKWEQQKRNILYLMKKHPHEFIFPQYVPNEMKGILL
jgi:predicted glycosyltransferase involved in capsule biosynthesis